MITKFDFFTSSETRHFDVSITDAAGGDTCALPTSGRAAKASETRFRTTSAISSCLIPAPAGPTGPAGPCGPIGPSGPCGPRGPGTPGSPGSPFAPLPVTGLVCILDITSCSCVIWPRRFAISIFAASKSETYLAAPYAVPKTAPAVTITATVFTNIFSVKAHPLQISCSVVTSSFLCCRGQKPDSVASTNKPLPISTSNAKISNSLTSYRDHQYADHQGE